MRNTFDFDWNLMVKLDPSYLQYLEDVNQIKLEEDENYGLRPGDPNIHRLTARQAAGLDPLEETNLDTDWRARGLSEEERAIVEMMHNDSKEEPEEKEEGGELIEGATLLDRVKQEITRMPEDIEPKYRLKAEYRDYPPAGHPELPMLPPPKQVLSIGSEFWINDLTWYEVHGGNEHNEDIVWLTKNKFYRKPDKVGMLKAVYRFDRVHNCATEKRKMFRMVVYNLKTAKLYFITGQDNGKGKRVTKKITQMGLNKNGVSAVLSCVDRRISIKFIQAVVDHVVGLIPDAYLPPIPKKNFKHAPTQRIRIADDVMDVVSDSTYRADLLYSVMIQHKVGQRLDWLSDENFMNNVSEFASQHILTNRLIGGKQVSNDEEQREAEKRDAKLKRKTLWTVFPNLRKRPGAKTVTKSLFGPFHRKFFHKIMTWEDPEKDFFMNATGFLMDIVYTLHNGKMPNELYHLIVALVKRGDAHARRQLGEISSLLSSLRGNDWDENPQTDPELVRQMGLYVRTVRNIMNIWDTAEMAVNEVLKWHTFRDTLDMAAELNIRVRVNKFQCVNDVRMLHDRLSTYQQRDLEQQNKYDMFDFLKFRSPEKEYDGFRFIQLLTPAELVDEGKNMHHCVGGYSKRCLTGQSIIYSMYKERSWITIEVDGADLTIRQKYTIKDFTVRNSSVNELILKWHADLNAMHKDDDKPYQQKALAYYEYQKSLEKIRRLGNMESDDLDETERTWLAQALRNAEEALERTSLEFTTEVSHATPFEQAYAQA